MHTSPPALTPPRQLILASTSRYRRELLERLRLPFEQQSPEVDETPLPGEAPAALATRLSLAKAAGASPGRGVSSPSGDCCSKGWRGRSSSSRR